MYIYLYLSIGLSGFMVQLTIVYGVKFIHYAWNAAECNVFVVYCLLP